MSEEETFPFVWDMIYFPLVVAMLFLNFFSDKEPQYVEGEVKCDVSRLNYCLVLILVNSSIFTISLEPVTRRSGLVCFSHDLSLVQSFGLEGIQTTSGI